MNVTTTVQDRAVTVEITEFGVTGVGVARCRPDDVFIPEIGKEMAMGRAVMAIGALIEESANQKVVTKNELLRVMNLGEIPVSELPDSFDGDVILASPSGPDVVVSGTDRNQAREMYIAAAKAFVNGG